MNNSVEIESAKVINYVFIKLKGIFPAWASSLKDESLEDAMKQEWLIALVENKITTKEKLALGFAKARKSNSPFLPSCGTFIQWCKKPVTHQSHLLCISKPKPPESLFDAGVMRLAELRKEQRV